MMKKLSWILAVVLAVPSLAQRGGPIRPITNLASQCISGVSDNVSCSGYERTWCVNYTSNIIYACDPNTHVWDAVGSGSGSVSSGEADHALTADALTTNGANCAAGSAPAGVSTTGAAESCTAYQGLDSDLTGLAALNFCINGQIAKSNGTVWQCAADASGAGTITYDLIASGTNTAGVQVCDTGCSLTPTGGTVVANSVICSSCVDMASDVAAFSSANFSGKASDETGTGVIVLATSPTLAGNPLGPTPTANDNDTSLVTSAYVQTELTAYASDTATLTNKTIDAEGTGNLLTIPSKSWLPAGGCQSTTAASLWDSLTANPAVAACVTGTFTQKGVLDFDATTNQFAQQTVMLPDDWTGGVDVKFVWLAAATSGNVIWGIQTICRADGELDDLAFNTASTVTDAAKATTLWVNTASITGITTTGCAAGELMHINVYRDAASGSDTMTGNARLIGVELTLRRAM